jgi:hypothetical protein
MQDGIETAIWRVLTYGRDPSVTGGLRVGASAADDEEEEEIQYTKDDPEKMYTDASTAPSSDEDNKA